MDDDERKEVSEEVEDTDADTSDIEDSQDSDYASLSKRLTAMEENQNRMLGVLSALQKAQSNFVEMGGTIRETIDDSSDDEGFVPIEKLDFTI